MVSVGESMEFVPRLPIHNCFLAINGRRTDERMLDCGYRECDTVLYSHFAHHFRNMCLQCTLYDIEWPLDLLVGKAGHQHFQNLPLTIGNSLRDSRQNLLPVSGGKTHEPGKYPTRHPN